MTGLRLRVSGGGTGVWVEPDPETIAYLTAPLWLFMARWVSPYSKHLSAARGAFD